MPPAVCSCDVQGRVVKDTKRRLIKSEFTVHFSTGSLCGTTVGTEGCWVSPTLSIRYGFASSSGLQPVLWRTHHCFHDGLGVSPDKLDEVEAQGNL